MHAPRQGLRKIKYSTMARIIHFEIPATDPEKSVAFYENVFGWEFSRWGEEPYWLAKTGEDNEPGINGAIMQRKDPQQPITNTIEVKDLNQTVAAIEKNGGEVVVPRMAIPTIGWLIYFKDPDGMITGALESNPDAK